MAVKREEQCNNSKGGVSELYIFPYDKLARSSFSVVDNFLTSFPRTLIYTIKSNTTSFTENVDIEDGGVVFNQAGEFVFNKITPNDNYKSFSEKDWRIIIKDENGNYRLIGLETGIEIKYKKETGAKLNDFNGFNFTYETKEENTAPFLENLNDFDIDIPTNPFIIEVTTTSPSETFTIPTIGSGYNYSTYTSDGQTSLGNTGDKTITFATAGTYDIEIRGSFPRIYFNDTGDKLKITDIKKWGGIVWDSFSDSFEGCGNLTGNFTDSPNLTNVSNLSYMFVDCTSFFGDISGWDVSGVTSLVATFQNTSVFNQDIGSWDVSNVTNMSQTFRSASAFNQDVGDWDVSNVTNMSLMFFFATSFDQDLSSWDISNVTSMSSMFSGVTLSTVNYDAILIGWEATLQTAFPSGVGYTPTISIDFGGSQYTLIGAASTARASLISTFGWTITDGGGV